MRSGRPLSTRWGGPQCWAKMSVLYVMSEGGSLLRRGVRAQKSWLQQRDKL